MRRLQLTLALLVVCGALLIPSAALARVSEYQVQYNVSGESGVGQLIVSVVLSPETTLPASVQVPLPAGATVMWSGEIVGQDPAADPFREAVVTATDGGLMATFTLEQVRIAQVEANLPAPTVSGNEVSSVLNWVNTGEEAPYTFGVVLPAGAGNVKISPAAGDKPVTNEAGEMLYALSPVRLAVGQAFAIDVRYSTGGGGGTTSTVLIIAAVVLGIALVTLLVVLSVQRAAKNSAGVAGDASSASSYASPEPLRGPSVAPPRTAPEGQPGTSEPERDGDAFFTFD